MHRCSTWIVGLAVCTFLTAGCGGSSKTPAAPEAAPASEVPAEVSAENPATDVIPDSPAHDAVAVPDVVGGAWTPGDAGKGKILFAESCANCHGPEGKGRGKIPSVYSATTPTASLIFPGIKKTMPKDDPGSLSDQEYRDIAEYIQNTSK